jgi:glycosyltransferase involved in cell wall biosynthesis
MAYERYALMQELGSVTKSRGATWVLEVNALLAVESTSERRATTSRWVATQFERRTLRRADVIVAVTEQLRTAINSTYGVPLERIVVVENGVDTTKHAKAAPTPHAVPTIGFLGTLYPWQRVDELLNAVKRSDTEWHVRVAGEGPEYETLKNLAAELEISHRVIFLGRVQPDDVPAFLQTVDVCYAGHGSANGVYFSPLKLWEYLAAGRPVIASSHETTDRLNSAGYAVEVFDGTAESLDEVLRSVAREMPTLMARAVADQDRVRKSHSWLARIQPLLRRVSTLRDAP